MCRDELGPVRAKTSPGEVGKEGPGRATVAPDDGRRGRGWVVGAVEPATGRATTRCRPRRDRPSFTPLLEQVRQTYPAREWGLRTAHLRTHLSRATPTALLAWPEVTLRCIPQSACWLNRSAPWGKQRRRLALKGRRFEHVDAIIEAVGQATSYGNQHRYPDVWEKAI
jgi:DDE superfamily endonuclease